MDPALAFFIILFITSNMAGLNHREPIGTRYLPSQLELIEQAARKKNLARATFIRQAATAYAKQVLAGAA